MKKGTNKNKVFDECVLAIKKTLAYSGVFKYPLSKFQLYTFLISSKDFNQNTYDKSLDKLIKTKKVRLKKGRYHLGGIRPLSWQRRVKNTNKLLENNIRAIKMLGKIPWVLFIGVTGSAAAYNCTSNDDIDIFIITKRKRLWISRLFVFSILKIINKYPLPEDTSNKICPNIYITEGNMTWPKNKRNIYIAHDVLRMQPIVNKKDTYFKFLNANDWALEYFNNYKVNFSNIFKPTSLPKSGLINWFESFAMKKQINYMQSKITNEVVSKNIIHFNKNDSTKKVLSKFKNLSSKLDN